MICRAAADDEDFVSVHESAGYYIVVDPRGL